MISFSKPLFLCPFFVFHLASSHGQLHLMDVVSFCWDSRRGPWGRNMQSGLLKICSAKHCIWRLFLSRFWIPIGQALSPNFLTPCASPESINLYCKPWYLTSYPQAKSPQTSNTLTQSMSELKPTPHTIAVHRKPQPLFHPGKAFTAQVWTHEMQRTAMTSGGTQRNDTI